MREPVRPVVDGDDPLDAGHRRSPRGPIDPALLRLAPPLRAHLLRCASLAVPTTAVVLVQAEVVGRGLPRLIDGDLGVAPALAAALLAVGALRFVLRWATEISASRAAAAARTTITERVIGHALVVDEAGAAQATPARVTTLVTDGVDALDPWIRSYVPALCVAGILPLAAGARILLADPPSAVILLVAIPLIPVFMVLIGKLAEGRADGQWATLQRLAEHFHDVLVGLPTLRLFGQAEVQVGRVRAVAEQYRAAVMRTLRVAFLSAAAMELLSMLSVALVAVTVGYRLTVGAVTLQTALIVLLLAPECSLPIRRVGAAFHAAQAGSDAADELGEVLSLSTTPDGSQTLAEPGPASTTLPGTPVLRIEGATVVDPVRGGRVGPVRLRVAPSELVALVGASGAGKSTLLDVVRGRVPLQRGSVELDGVAIGDLSRAARSGAIAWIPQLADPVGSDVRSVVADGRSDDTTLDGDLPDDVLPDRALPDDALPDDALPDRALPDGVLPDRAVLEEVLATLDLTDLAHRRPDELSGGERQRVAAARALLRCRTDPAIRLLLADEPTSHLDPVRAGMVLQALREVTSLGIAVLLATHDPRLVESSDAVVRLPATTDDADTTSPISRDDSGGAPPDRPRRRAAADPDARAASVGSPPGPSMPSAGPGAPDAPGPPGSADDLAWFRRMARTVRLRLLLGRVVAVAAELCTVGLAAAASWMLVRGAQVRSFAELTLAAAAVRTFALAKGVLRYGERLVSHDATFRLLSEVRGAVVARLGRIAPAGIPGMERGDVMSRVVDDVDRLADLELRVTGPMISGLAVGLLAVAGAAMLSPGVGVAYAVAVAVVAVGLPALTRVLTARNVADRAQARGELAGATAELVEHADELVTTGADRRWRVRIADAVATLGRVERRHGVRIGFAEGVASFAAPALAAGVVVADRATGGTLDGALLAVAVLVPFALLEVLTPLLHAGAQLPPVLTAARRLRDVFDAPDPVAEPEHPAPLPSGTDVVLEGVSIRWPQATADTLSGLDLRVDPGERVRILGRSGSGKSTLAAALVRFIDLADGRYSIGGVDSADLGGEHVRELVTWCQQSPWLAAASLRENLHVAAPGASDEELWSALDAVHLSDWAIALPEGLATLVGHDGQGMSGGQRQRLALARVLLAGHRVVVLDEPTAHLDAATAEGVLTDMIGALSDRTVVVLGHDDGSVWPGWSEQHLAPSTARA